VGIIGKNSKNVLVYVRRIRYLFSFSSSFAHYLCGPIYIYIYIFRTILVVVVYRGA